MYLIRVLTLYNGLLFRFVRFTQQPFVAGASLSLNFASCSNFRRLVKPVLCIIDEIPKDFLERAMWETRMPNAARNTPTNRIAAIALAFLLPWQQKPFSATFAFQQDSSLTVLSFDTEEEEKMRAKRKREDSELEDDELAIELAMGLTGGSSESPSLPNVVACRAAAASSASAVSPPADFFKIGLADGSDSVSQPAATSDPYMLAFYFPSSLLIRTCFFCW